MAPGWPAALLAAMTKTPRFRPGALVGGLHDHRRGEGRLGAVVGPAVFVAVGLGGIGDVGTVVAVVRPAVLIVVDPDGETPGLAAGQRARVEPAGPVRRRGEVGGPVHVDGAAEDRPATAPDHAGVLRRAAALGRGVVHV